MAVLKIKRSKSNGFRMAPLNPYRGIRKDKYNPYEGQIGYKLFWDSKIDGTYVRGAQPKKRKIFNPFNRLP